MESEVTVRGASGFLVVENRPSVISPSHMSGMCLSLDPLSTAVAENTSEVTVHGASGFLVVENPLE